MVCKGAQVEGVRKGRGVMRVVGGGGGFTWQGYCALGGLYGCTCGMRELGCK